MGRIVFAAAMSHVLDPDYYGTHCGPRGRKMVEELMALVGEMGGGRMAAARPDALMVVADDHLKAITGCKVLVMACPRDMFLSTRNQASSILSHTCQSPMFSGSC